MMNEKRTLIGWAVAAVIAFLAVAFLAGCSTTTQIEKEYVHDTIRMANVVHDSVDRWRTHYEFVRGDTIFIVDTFYKSKVHFMHDTLVDTKVEYKDKEIEKIVEKKVYLWWPGLVLFVFLVAVIFGGGYVVAKMLSKLELEEDEESFGDQDKYLTN